MSGGVDSSVAAWLLRQQGHEVIGVFMRHGQDRMSLPMTSCGPRQGCCTADDAADARRVADALEIPFYAVNFERQFSRVVDYFVAQYAAGRTPNPCIVCNTWLKFGALVEYADGIGAEFLATGHHAMLVPMADGQIAICRGHDASKDQSYVLFGIQRQLLPRLMFPVGQYRKEEIRGIAERLGLPVAAKRDSQEICFIPDRDHARFVRHRQGNTDTSGEIVTTDGTVVGRHTGIEQFTIGQRKGLRLAFGTPRYVVRIEPDANRVVIGVEEELARTELIATEANWLIEKNDECGMTNDECEESASLRDCETASGTSHSVKRSSSFIIHHSSFLSPFRAEVKIRYRSRPIEATVKLLPDGMFHVRFDRPCFGVAPGQAAVCYRHDRVLGGGWIQ
jgi:tRNA-uridine 2-sulfurtransferase